MPLPGLDQMKREQDEYFEDLLQRIADGTPQVREFAAIDVADRAELHALFALFIGGNDGDGLGPQFATDLNGEATQTAGAAPDEGDLAGLDLPFGDEHPVGGEVG